MLRIGSCVSLITLLKVMGQNMYVFKYIILKYPSLYFVPSSCTLIIGEVVQELLFKVRQFYQAW